MNKHGTQFSAVLLGFGILGSFGACSGSPQEEGAREAARTLAPGAHDSDSNTQTSTAGGAGSSAAGSPAPSLGNAGAGAPQSGSNTMHADSDCADSGPFKKEGCPCKSGDTAACWTGPLADRNVRTCHDGLQLCSTAGDNEFATWGPCMGEELECGTPDGGAPPPPPPPDEDCSCIPGAVIQCSEDCSVGIVCSLTATKECLPDGTWSVCREDMGVTLDLPGVQCRNMLHGCLDLLNPGAPGQNEAYVGDCSKQFKCGHSPPPPTDDPPTEEAPPE